MSAPKHTPGPWHFSTDPQPNGCPIIGSNRGVMLAMLAHSVNHDDQRGEAVANALLIAAAPDLLEALKCCIPFMKYPRDASDLFVVIHDAAIAKARAVIAKAEGAAS